MHLADAATSAAIDVALPGALPVAAQTVGGYVVYPAALPSGATVLHRPLAAGSEDFVSLPVRLATPEVDYTLTLGTNAAGLRLVGGTLEVLDAGGAPRFHVPPPFIVGADGVSTDGALAVSGCAVDTDPSPPWGRPVTSPGAASCTVSVTWPDAAVVYPAILDPRWTTTGSMGTARFEHTLLLLSIGRALAAGGRSTTSGTTGLASAELYDPTTGTWSATGSLAHGRRLHSATQLPTSSNPTTSGHVLVAGGISGSTSMNTAELYSTSAGTWSAAGTMDAARHGHTATLLPDGRVLAAGGLNGTTTLATASLYNPASGSGSWVATTGPIPPPGLKNHTATLIQTTNNELNNHVLLVGGDNGTSTMAQVLLFDPVQNAFSTLASISSPREQHTALALPNTNGKILVTGGKNGSTVLATAIVFDPSVSNGSWSSAGTMTTARVGHSMTLLPNSIVANGSVLVAGGSSTGSNTLSSAELFSGTSTWTATPSMPGPLQGQQAVLLSGNMILVAGGLSTTTTVQTAAYLYDASFGLACTSNTQCASGFCVAGVCCNSACTDQCQACNIAGSLGTCSPKANGTTCNDGNACTQTDSCQSGTCTGSNPVICTQQDQCHAVGTCNTSTGVCSNPTKTDGTACNDGNACTQTDTCQAGVCTGSNPVTCVAEDQCHTAGTCNTSTGACSNPTKTDGTTCDDGNACTQTDTCQAGSCTGTNPITCVPSDQCHGVGTCDPSSGICSNPALANGTPCNDGNACTTGETCQAGACGSGTTVTCTADQCHTAGACDPSSGCPTPVAKADGTACNDGNACTQTDACQGGSCIGGNPVTCPPASQCQSAGTCNPTTGACSNTNLADGTPCNNGNLCTTGETCQGGACNSGTPVTCTASDECHTRGYCDTTDGSCAGQAARPDGTPCAGGVCMSAICEPVSAASAVPTPIDRTVPMDLQQSTAFLYTGPNASQIGVAPGTIVRNRACVLRGKVFDNVGNPIEGASVVTMGHPEYGVTVTGADGVFSMAVNGGEDLRLQYQAAGCPTMQRTVLARELDYSWLPDVVMTPTDPKSTNIDFTGTAGMQVAEATPVTDASGTRRSVLLFPPGTTASIVQPTGESTPVGNLTVHSTECTVGPSGPQAMPAPLPNNSGYTYADDLSVDELQPGDFSRVTFNQPVIHYVDNFLHFSVGSPVPAGYYDEKCGCWLALDNGLVIQVLDTSTGVADVDTNGDGLADSPSTLAAVGITDTERATLATLYTAGQSLWRVPLPHFTREDINWPITSPPEPGPIGPIFQFVHGGTPDDTDTNVDTNSDPTPTDCQDSSAPDDPTGSIVGCQKQTLGESVSIVGTPYHLRYMSARVPGYGSNVLNVMVSGPSHRPELTQIEMDVNIAGQHFQQIFPPVDNQSTSIVWDGLDGFGRALTGRQPATVAVKYTYPAVYLAPPAAIKAFAANPLPGAQIDGDTGRGTMTLERDMFAQLSHPDARAAEGLGGWSLDVHNTYDPKTLQLSLGNGLSRSTPPVGLTPIQGLPVQTFSFLPAADGSLYFGYNIPFANNHDLSRLNPDGTVQDLVPGSSPWMIHSQGPNILWLESGNGTEPNIIRRLAADGTVTDFAGNTSCDGSVTLTGDEGPATEACFGLEINDFKVSDTGEVYILSGGVLGPNEPPLGSEFREWLRKVDCSGIVHAITPSVYSSLQTIALGPGGVVYVMQEENATSGMTIRQLEPDGTVSSPLAGQTTGTALCADDDGSNGVRDHICLSGGFTQEMEMGPDGKLYFVMPIQLFHNQSTTRMAINVVRPDGKVAEVFPGLGMNVEFGFMIAPDGDFIVSASAPVVNPTTFGFFHLNPSLPPVSDAGYSVVSVDGSEIYKFDGSGRHITTSDGAKSTQIYAFGYDTNNFVASITDRNGRTTSIIRDGSGKPTAVVSPTGETTTLGTDADGYLASVVSPGGAQYQFQYSNGLLTQETDRRGGIHQYTYDARGRLLTDQNPLGGGWTFSSSGGAITMTSGEGRTKTYSTGSSLTSADTSLLASAGSLDKVIVGRDGLQSFIHQDAQGDQQVTLPDGLLVSTTMAPDPRNGFAAPYASSQTISTPGGLVLAETVSRTASTASDGVTLLSQTDSFTVNGHTMTKTYDGSTNTMTLTSPAGRQSVVVRDAHGRLVYSQAGGLAPTSFSYDTTGNLTSIVSGGGADVRVRSFTYDAFSRPSVVTDPLSRQTSFSYDGDNRVASVVTPDGAVAASVYDLSGDLMSRTPPGELPHQFSYTAAGDLASYSPPAVDSTSPTTSFSYNTDRQLTTVRRPDGSQIAYSFDGAGRIATLTYPADVSALTSGTVSVTYNYSATTGKLSTLTASDGEALALSFDGILQTGTALSGGVAGSYTVTYDNGFLFTSEGVNGLSPTAMSYDPDNLLVGIGAMTIQRDAQSGVVTGSQVANATDTRSVNQFGEPSQVTSSVNGTQLFQETVTSRDGFGRIEQLQDVVSGVSSTWVYSYDAAGRLWQVSKNGALSAEYLYDANGNRVAAPGLATPPTYDAQDRLLTYGSYLYTYAETGELESKTDTTTGAVTAFHYDGTGSLRRVDLADGRRIDYVIDPIGRRVGKKVNGTLVKAWLYGRGFAPVAEMDGSGNMSWQIVGGSYLVGQGTIFRIIKDHAGSARLIVDANTGSIAQQLEYDEYGQVTADSAPGFQPLGFGGGLYDPDTGLVRFGARDYDAATGRWTAKDSRGLGAGLNLYRYVGDDPVNQSDPNGLSELIFQGSTTPQSTPGALTLLDGQGNVVWWTDAGNKLTNPPIGNPGADPWQAGGHGYAPNGVFPLGNTCNKGANGQFTDESLDILVPERPGLKIHANGETTCPGAADPVMCGTLGCIRISADAMHLLCDYARDNAASDPLTQITIEGNPNSPEANPSTVTVDDSQDDNTSLDAISGGDPLGDYLFGAPQDPGGFGGD